MTILQYALISDLHSQTKHTKKVLKHIEAEAPNAKVLCLGDIYECTIGKKKAATIRNAKLKDAAIVSDKFEQLIQFPSIIGNQEERIALVTGIERFLQYPETIEIEHATLMHGHQFEWDEQFIAPTFPKTNTQLLFFGHSHRSAIYINGERTIPPFHTPLPLGDQVYQINVGSVVDNKEWCLYDSTTKTVQFMKA